MNNMCESCGMSLKDDIKGTRSDGQKSDRYCRYCYENSAFRQPEVKCEEMRAFSVQGMTEKGWPRFVAKMLTRNMHELPRWVQGDPSEPVE